MDLGQTNIDSLRMEVMSLHIKFNHVTFFIAQLSWFTWYS
jgi:hypothetical protein